MTHLLPPPRGGGRGVSSYQKGPEVKGPSFRDDEAQPADQLAVLGHHIHLPAPRRRRPEVGLVRVGAESLGPPASNRGERDGRNRPAVFLPDVEDGLAQPGRGIDGRVGREPTELAQVRRGDGARERADRLQAADGPGEGGAGQGGRRRRGPRGPRRAAAPPAPPAKTAARRAAPFQLPPEPRSAGVRASAQRIALPSSAQNGRRPTSGSATFSVANIEKASSA